MANYGSTDPSVDAVSGVGVHEPLLTAADAAATPEKTSRRVVAAVACVAAISGTAAAVMFSHHTETSAQELISSDVLPPSNVGKVYTHAPSSAPNTWNPTAPKPGDDDSYYVTSEDDDFVDSVTEGYDDDYYDGNTTYGLTCNYFDDDTVYPNNGCNYGDSGVCLDAVSDSENFYNTCFQACDEESMLRYEWGSHTLTKFSNASWAVVCGWEAVKALPQLCNGTFAPDIDNVESQDMSPRAYDVHSRKKVQNVTGTSYHGCNLHAFCSSCEETDVNGVQTYNKYCEAMTDYYGSGALYELRTFFNYLDTFWCQDAVLEAIDDGSFKDKYHKWVSDDDDGSTKGLLWSDDVTTQNQVHAEKEKREKAQVASVQKEKTRPGNRDNDAVAWNAITHGLGVKVGKTVASDSRDGTLSLGPADVHTIGDVHH